MHPITQTILAAGVLTLVGMGGYVVAFGVPERTVEMTTLDRLKAANERADDQLCRFNISREWGELNENGRADRVRCLARN